VPPKSVVWKYFVKTQTGGKCKICELNVKTSGNTTNLKYHLEHSHPKIEMGTMDMSVSRQKRKIEDEEKDDVLSIPEDNRVLSPALSTDSIISLQSTSSRKTTPKKQPRIDMTFIKQKSFQDGGLKETEITNKLLFMIAKDNLPFQIVEKEGFKVFIKSIAPLYKAPCRKTITNMMENKYELLSSLIKSKLSVVKHLSLTTDIWTDTLNTKSFLGLTCHFILDNEYKSIAIGVMELDERHTAKNLETWLLKMIQDWNINKDNITVVVSDSGSNIKKAIKDAFGADKHLSSLSCFGHSLNLVPSNVMHSENINSICYKVKDIVRYFKQSVIAADKLRGVSDLKLIQSEPTRWNSSYYMFNRFIELSGKISSILLECPKSPSMLSAFEVQSIKEFVDLLQPFEDATKIVSGESYLTGSKIISIVNTLRRNLELVNPKTDTGTRLKQLLLAEFNQRFACIEQVSNLAISTILDPRFKRLHFLDKVTCSYAINKITTLVNNTIRIENSVTDVEQNSSSTKTGRGFWSYHEDLVNLNKLKENIIHLKCRKN